MPALYASWIELPASDLDRAVAFYRAVFGLEETPFFEEPPAKIALLVASEKEMGKPGVSLVLSPLHQPSSGGVIINFHVDTHSDLDRALQIICTTGGSVEGEVVDMGDGVRYVHVRDSEGNRIALSSYEPHDGETCDV